MRGDMLSYMKEHPAAVSPVRKSDPIRHSMGIGKHFPLHLLVTHNRMFAGIFLAIIAAFSGGTVFAAQGALPGDVLYPIKVNVNEEIRGAFTVNAEAKVAWETTLAERRSHEAAALETEGALDADIAADLSARLATHIDKAESLMAELEAKGNLEAAANAQSRLEALLSVQQRIFQSLEDDATADTDDDTTDDSATTTPSTDDDDADEDEHVLPITHILNALEHKADVQARVRADYAEKLEEKDEDDRARTLAQTKQVTETKITTTEKILLTFEEKNGARTEAHAAFDAAVTMKQEADRKLLAKEYGDAFELYHKAQTMLDRVHLFLRTSAAVGIEVRIDTDNDDDKNDDRNRSDEKHEDVNDQDTDDEQNADDADEKEDDDDTDEDDALNIEIETDALLDIDDKETRSESKSRVNIGL